MRVKHFRKLINGRGYLLLIGKDSLLKFEVTLGPLFVAFQIYRSLCDIWVKI